MQWRGSGSLIGLIGVALWHMPKHLQRLTPQAMLTTTGMAFLLLEMHRTRTAVGAAKLIFTSPVQNLF
jgi:hypothetical protein